MQRNAIGAWVLQGLPRRHGSGRSCRTRGLGAARSTGGGTRLSQFEAESGLSDDGVLAFDGSGLLEQPLLKHLDFSEALRARRINDEGRVPSAHAARKQTDQPSRCTLRFDE